MRSVIVIPTYNESESIEEVVRRCFESCPACDMLIVDDSSADGTGDIARALAERYSITVVTRPEKAGLGTAYVAGFQWALDHGYDAIVAMDADLSHDPSVIPDLLERLEHRADLAIGSRYVPDGSVSNWGALRRLLSRAGNAYARLWLRFGVRDSTSGFRAYSAGALRALDLSTLRSEGYAFQIETAFRVHAAGGDISEVPITFVERQHGRSKLSRAIVFEALLRVPVWGLRRRKRK